MSRYLLDTNIPQHSWGKASSKGMGGLMYAPKDSPKAWLKSDRSCSRSTEFIIKDRILD